MIQRDYIIRLIQQLIDSLFMLFDKKDLSEEELSNQLENMYIDYLDESKIFYRESSMDDVISFLQNRYGDDEYLYRIEMLTEIMYQDGMHDNDKSEKQETLLKALELLVYLDNYSNVYSLVREGKMEAIKKELKQ
ncbi:hypothetical protein [Dysgonomonas massiliensis]|uniref:hypothetical protein n=1 Tax=Dysgonomonas massiliensis TaxID=2040292 RepID=UPI000C76930C|nr:hypothetical protein [Dysgonomonas massiliensis]